MRRILTYGAAAPDSIFDVGSVTKPFTGVLLAEMVERRLVRFDEPVRELIPMAGLPRPSGSDITLLDLATHHSSLPPMPPTFRPADRLNPFADFDVSKLYAFLAVRGVERRPDAGFVYSNMGFGLLGHALGRRAGVDYATLVRQLIAEPLGLTDIAVTIPAEQPQRFLQGYNDDREPIPAWDLDALIGAGGLHSTAPDMLAWLEANLHPERVRPPTLSAALISSQRVRVRVSEHVGVGLDWIIDSDTGTFHHGGATAGFTADAFFNPTKDRAAIILSNVGPGTAASADVLGEHIRARLDGKAAVSLAEVTIPRTGGVFAWLRLLSAYWLTMTSAGVFVFALAMSALGFAAAVVPRRYFLRVSSLLQLTLLGVVIATYFFQPMVVRPAAILTAQEGGLLALSPSFWFLGLFQELSGSAALAPLARRAWIGLGLSHPRMFVYAVPQAIVLAVPIGFTLGIFFGLRGRSLSARLTGTVLACAIFCSGACLATLAWILPSANQIDWDPRVLAYTYHMRWAFSCATLVLALFALAMARRIAARWAVALAAVCACFSYYVLMWIGRAGALQEAVPAFVGAWLPNAAFVLVWLALTAITAGGQSAQPGGSLGP
jgi:CubicO group peptidase (beta-lactamase class C family)